VGTEHGIGLFLVAGYIDKAGGSIEIADNTPQGTIFLCLFRSTGLKHDTTRPLDVVIVEDEPHLAELHREYIEQNFHLRVVGIAASIEQACSLIRQHQPRLILLDNYLPDGKGVELIDNPLLKSFECSVIFITAASDMQTCSHAMRSGAFDYLIKPVFFQRLHASLERFMRFIHTVQQVKVVDQHALDRLFNLPAAEASSPVHEGH
jgi:two-component system response regulator CitB